MFDIHALEKKIHGFKDFLLHIITITIGLLIALALEGAVEWKHHRDLVHEAESSLRGEIAQNISTLASIKEQIKNEQKTLDDDLSTLSVLRAQPDATDKHMSFEFTIESFDDTAWKTSQTAGAFNYMPYGSVEEFSQIYDGQDEVYKAQHQALDAFLSAASLVITRPKGETIPATAIELISERIGKAKLRLNFLNSVVNSLENVYRDYENNHPDALLAKASSSTHTEPTSPPKG